MTDDPNNASRQLSENIGTETRAQSVAAEATVTAKDAGRLGDAELARLTDEIIAALKTVYDPEIPADIYELGLIYKVDIKDDRTVDVVMTLTTPNCPAAGELP